MKFVLVGAIMFVLLISGCGSYTEEIDNCNSKPLGERLNCFVELASEKNSGSICLSIDSGYLDYGDLTAACMAQVAVRTDDEDLCDFVCESNQEFCQSCYGHFQEETTPNLPQQTTENKETPEEVENLVSSENFKDEFNNLDKWDIETGNWRIENGELTEDTIEGKGGHWKAIKAKYENVGDFKVNFDYKTKANNRGCTFLINYQGEEFDPSIPSIALAIFSDVNQVSLYLGGEHKHMVYIEKDEIYHFELELKDGLVDVRMDSKEIITSKSTYLSGGAVYFLSDDDYCAFDNLEITKN